MAGFGRRAPPDWKHVEKYPFRLLRGAVTVPKVEKVLDLPHYRSHYNQGETNGCVGFSSSWMMSIYNRERYNATWLYHRACEIDGDPETTPEADIGTYVRSAFDAIRKLGHMETEAAQPDPRNGILSFYWCTSVDEIRTAISINRPVVLGINWYEEFMKPRWRLSGYWIGTRFNLGFNLGGHAICCYGASDARQAFKLVNSWGGSYPTVWIPYEIVRSLLGNQGEAVVAVDKAGR